MCVFLLLAAGVHTGKSPCANARKVLGEVTKTDSWGAAPPPTHVYVSRPSPGIPGASARMSPLPRDNGDSLRRSLSLLCSCWQ